jgi:hypothetical protein
MKRQRGIASVVCLALLFIFLTACAKDMPSIVKIPVPVQCPEPPPVIRPHLPLMPANPAPDEYVRLIEISLETVMGYAEKLEKLLEGYRK